MRKDLFIGVVVIAIAVACIVNLITLDQRFVMEDQVSASFFPFLMVGILAFLGVMQVITSIAAILGSRKDPAGRPERIDWGALKERYQVPILMFIFVSGYIFLIPVVGFYTMTVIFFICLGMLLGGVTSKNLLKVSAASAATIVFMYFVFEVTLQVYMPSGVLY